MNSNRYPGDLNGCRALLLGLGTRTNVELARHLVRQGALVTVSDRKPAEELQVEIGLLHDLPVRLSLGGHREDEVLRADIVFVSPGVPRDIPVLQTARQKGVAISSEIELLFAECRSPIVGITGSSGKTTTTSLVGDVIRAAGMRSFVGGNIGTPLIGRLDEIGDDAWVVLELSSFQLESMTISPQVGAILNITPNHLDRHRTMANYSMAKLNIVRHQRSDDIAVLSLDDPIAAGLAEHCGGRVRYFSRSQRVDEGAALENHFVVLRQDGLASTVCHRQAIQLLGEHNLLNVLAATAIAGAVGVPSDAIAKAVTTFRGVEHRLELIRTLNGVRFYNDSIATAPERAIAALQSVEPPIVLIAGGRSKHLPLADWALLAVERCRAVITIGEMAEELETTILDSVGCEKLVVRSAGDLSRAVVFAVELAEPGDAVLLSPGGTSFDAYRDFEERGRHFKELVWEL